MDKKLKGKTLLASCCKSFEMSLEITALGHVGVKYSMATTQFAQPQNVSWSASGDFVFEPSKIKGIVKEIDEQS